MSVQNYTKILACKIFQVGGRSLKDENLALYGIYTHTCTQFVSFISCGLTGATAEAHPMPIPEINRPVMSNAMKSVAVDV